MFETLYRLVFVLLLGLVVTDLLIRSPDKSLLGVTIARVWKLIKEFFVWLMGARKTYYFFLGSSSKDAWRVTNTNIRNFHRWNWNNIDRILVDSRKSVIEVSRGLSRRRSQIYGYFQSHWEITETGPMRASNDRGKTERVTLRSIGTVEMPVEQALWLINKYPTLQSLIGRIETLEDELEKAKDHEITLESALRVIHEDLEAGRKGRYRSQVVAEIRERIEWVIDTEVVHGFSQESLAYWRKHFQEFEAARLSK